MVKISCDCGVSSFPLIGETIGYMFNRIAKENPDNEAVVSVHHGIRWTYREFQGRVDNLAKGLMALGVEKGHRVGI